MGDAKTYIHTYRPDQVLRGKLRLAIHLDERTKKTRNTERGEYNEFKATWLYITYLVPNAFWTLTAVTSRIASAFCFQPPRS